ncbi:hypothetical protein Tco_0922776 [Tanacetum coccineum]|uniref:Uncharacterized protein n=1 Tax=Tanacetum coccineum TaxID=301880 RepID=A0ABQ5D1X3_9ASTR
MRKPKRGNVDQVDVLVSTTQKEIMVPVENCFGLAACWECFKTIFVMVLDLELYENCVCDVLVAWPSEKIENPDETQWRHPSPFPGRGSIEIAYASSRGRWSWEFRRNCLVNARGGLDGQLKSPSLENTVIEVLDARDLAMIKSESLLKWLDFLATMVYCEMGLAESPLPDYVKKYVN